MLARVLTMAMCMGLTACAWNPVVLYGHVSDPSEGPPFTVQCEDVADFAGGGMGRSWGKGSKTRLYIVGGAKRFRVCPDDRTRPANVRHEPAGALLLIQEFEGRR